MRGFNRIGRNPQSPRKPPIWPSGCRVGGFPVFGVEEMFLTPMDAHDKMRLRAAAFRATKVYPGVVGEFLSREILSWEEFGYRLGSSAQVRALVDHILKTDIPEIPPSRYGGGGGGDGRPATTSAVGYGG